MQIREATKEDFETFKKLQNQIHSYHANERSDIYKAHRLEAKTYERLLEDKNRKIIFVEDVVGEVLGYLMLKIAEDPDATNKNMVVRKVVSMSEICVDQGHRGKGVGKFLFKEAVAYARSVDADGFELGVWEFNQSAIKFYETLGMKTQIRKMELEL